MLGVGSRWAGRTGGAVHAKLRPWLSYPAYPNGATGRGEVAKMPLIRSACG